MRGALVLIPVLQTVLLLMRRDDTKPMGVIWILSLVMLGCACAFCIAFGERMFDRVLLVSGMGTLLMLLALWKMVFPVDWWTILVTIYFGLEFFLSILYAVGRKYWLFL
jgi:hypothetical protein